jgi:hypothetical protein
VTVGKLLRGENDCNKLTTLSRFLEKDGDYEEQLCIVPHTCVHSVRGRPRVNKSRSITTDHTSDDIDWKEGGVIHHPENLLGNGFIGVETLSRLGV